MSKQLTAPMDREGPDRSIGAYSLQLTINKATGLNTTYRLLSAVYCDLIGGESL
jgi:hypothetical protein